MYLCSNSFFEVCNASWLCCIHFVLEITPQKEILRDMLGYCSRKVHRKQLSYRPSSPFCILLGNCFRLFIEIWESFDSFPIQSGTCLALAKLLALLSSWVSLRFSQNHILFSYIVHLQRLSSFSYLFYLLHSTRGHFCLISFRSCLLPTLKIH